MDRNCIRYRPSQYSKATVVAFLLFMSGMAYSTEKVSDETFVDGLAATVKSVPILHSEIQSKIERGQTVIISPYPAKEDASEFEKALQDQINFELILQRVDELELSVTESEIDSEISKFLSSRKLTLAGLQEALEQQGMTYEQYKEDFADQIVIRKFQGRVINPLIKITDKDLESYYLKRVGSTSENVSLKLRQIFIKTPSDSSDVVTEGKLDRAQEVYEKLKAGMDFGEAAKVFSDLPGATENGGAMAAIQLSDLSQQVRDVIAPLAEGEFTQPISTPAGYYIFFLEKRQFSGSSGFDKQKQRLEFELRSEELANQTQKWLVEQRRLSKIKIIN